MDEEKDPAKEKKQRHRSPNYPAVGLREAIERVKKLWQQDGKAGAPPNLAAVHIGFAKPHGQAMSVLAALKRFGLVADNNGRLAPTHRAIEIINLPEPDERRKKALREAALSPEIYRQLIEEHKQTGFPAQDVLQSELVTYKNFNRESVKSFVSDFLDSLEFAGISDLNALDLIREGEELEIEAGTKQREAVHSEDSKPDLPLLDPLRRPSGESRPMQRNYSFGLSETVNAKVEIIGPVEVEDLEALKDYVETLIKSWRRKTDKQNVHSR